MLGLLAKDDVMGPLAIESYHQVMLDQWATELHNRILPNNMDLIRGMVKLHTLDRGDSNELDQSNWRKVNDLRNELGKDTLEKHCLLKQIGMALDEGDWQRASDLQKEMQEKIELLQKHYTTYKKNLF